MSAVGVLEILAYAEQITANGEASAERAYRVEMAQRARTLLELVEKHAGGLTGSEQRRYVELVERGRVLFFEAKR